MEAETAEDGLAQVRQHLPDLILMDIQLPGIDGYSAVKMLKQDPELRKIPVLALTAHAMEGHEKQAMQAGFDGYITKPINTKSFRKTIADFFQNGSETPKAAEVTRSKFMVLIVDDDPLNVKLLAGMLPKDKYQCCFSNDGETALQEAAAHLPDVILLDVMMPGLNGFEVTRKLKQDSATKEIPVILVTALSSPEDKICGMEAGADEFLNKPVNSVELLARIKSLTNLKRYQEQFKVRGDSKQAIATASSQSPQELDVAEPTVLMIEDEEIDIKLIQENLLDTPYRLEVARSAEEAIGVLDHKKVDVLLLDILLPGMDGFELCKRLKSSESTRNIQVLIVTCLSDMNSKIRGIDLGVDDYIVKPFNRAELKARINAAIKKKEYLDSLSHGLMAAMNSAITDRLTGLYNQAYLKHFLELEIARCQRHGCPLSLIMADLDDFKRVNDTLGHLEGDRVIGEVGRLIRNHVRAIDVAARYGGDEFVIVLPYTGVQAAEETAERIRSELASCARLGDALEELGGLSVSIGISGYGPEIVSAMDMLRQADKSLYHAKENGKNRIEMLMGP
jgi:two-component system cell cycle response regulator